MFPALVNAYSHITVQCRCNRCEPLYIFFHFLQRAGKARFVRTGIQRNDFTAKAVKDTWKELCSATICVIDNKLEFMLLHQWRIEHLHESADVTVDHIGIFKDFNRSQIIQVHATEILAGVQILKLELGCIIDIKAILVEELDIDHALIMRREAHMYPSNGIGFANEKARHWYRHLIDIMHVDAS